MNLFWLRTLWLLACLASLSSLSSCGGGGGGGGVVAPVTTGTPGTTATLSIASKQTGISYTVNLWLPPGYASSTALHRTIYAMDCEYRFTTLSSVLQQSSTDAILVNVCAMSSDRRWVDFTMPGAAPYFRFLTQELIPLIEASYKASPTGRILSGHSLSGEFALYALLLEDPARRFFTSIVSEECSCWYSGTQVFSEQLAQPLDMLRAMAAASPTLPVNLVMAGDTLSNQTHVAAAYALFAAQHFSGLRATQPVYSLGHVPMDGKAFGDALKFIAAGP